MIEFNASVTVSGVVAFFGNASNNGDIIGDATFADNSRNGEDGVVVGNAEFTQCATNEGIVTGTVTMNRDPGCPPAQCEAFTEYDPPLLAEWQTAPKLGFSYRRLVCLVNRNRQQISTTVYGGGWQLCPAAGCFAYPNEYVACISYQIDYEKNPGYSDYPGN